MIGYDLGGAELPIAIVEDDVEWTVVDMQDPDWEVYDLPQGKFIRQDLREDFSYLEPADRVYIGGMLRYLTDKEGYLSGSNTSYLNQIEFAKRLDKIVKPGGLVTIRDHLEVCSYILTDLIILGYAVRVFELNNPYDEDLPSDWVIALQKHNYNHDQGVAT